MKSFLFLFPIVLARPELLLVKKNDVINVNMVSFAEEHSLETVFNIDNEYVIYGTNIENFNTFANTFTDVFDVEENGDVYIFQKQFVLQKNTPKVPKEEIPWHLARINKRDLPLSETYKYNTSGSCHKNKDIVINTYVIDTGIDITHPQFEGRAKWLKNFVDDDDTDCQNHGTHCSGLISSRDYGVCKDANLFAIKVLDCNGSGKLSSVIKGIQYAYEHHTSLPDNTRGIVSMSLGGGYSPFINKAVEMVIKKSKTLYFTVAAGNEDGDACKTSPASVKDVITVMASDKKDNRAYFSNWGKCADIFAPGVDIISTVPNGKTAVYSGSSMSTPIIAGVLNHYLDSYPDMTLVEIKEKLILDSIKDKLSDVPDDTANLLVYLERK